MSNVKFFKTTSDNLPPISDGQFIAVTDTGEIYIDTGEERKVYGGADFSGTGKYSVQIGSYAEAGGEHSVSIGSLSEASSMYTTAIGPNSKALTPYSTAIGINSKALTPYSTAIGFGACTDQSGTLAIGDSAKVTAEYSIQLGYGETSEENTFSVGLEENYVLLSNGGKIPDERLNDTIARVADIPDIPDTSNFITTETFDNKLNADCVAIGENSSSTGSCSIAIGSDSLSTLGTGIAIGWRAEAMADGAIQLGFGINSEQYTLSVGWYKTLEGMERVNYTLLTSDGKIPLERLPNGIGGSSWTKTTDTSTTEISLIIADQIEYVYNASATSVSITVTDFTGESVVHFSSGSTASTFTCAAKMIGYHCYGGTFTPVKNTRYSIMFSHDGLNVIGHVGGYANG